MVVAAVAAAPAAAFVAGVVLAATVAPAAAAAAAGAARGASGAAGAAGGASVAAAAAAEAVVNPWFLAKPVACNFCAFYWPPPPPVPARRGCPPADAWHPWAPRPLSVELLKKIDCDFKQISEIITSDFP